MQHSESYPAKRRENKHCGKDNSRQQIGWSVEAQAYYPSCNPWEFCNINSMVEYRFHCHLKVWWLNKAYPQTPKKWPMRKKFYTHQNLWERILWIIFLKNVDVISVISWLHCYKIYCKIHSKDSWMQELDLPNIIFHGCSN